MLRHKIDGKLYLFATHGEKVCNKSEVINEGSDNRYYSQVRETENKTTYEDGWICETYEHYEPGDMFNSSDRWTTERWIKPKRTKRIRTNKEAALSHH